MQGIQALHGSVYNGVSGIQVRWQTRSLSSYLCTGPPAMFPSLIGPILACFLIFGCATSGAKSTNQTSCSGPEAPYFRDYFMVGGSYTDDGTGEGTHAFQGQMYVERLKPLAGANHSYPLVLIHGAGQTGTVS